MNSAMMGRLAPHHGGYPDEGGTAVMEPPRTRDEQRPWQDGLRKGGRTVGVMVRDVVSLMGHDIIGEVEPRHDARYERQPIRLRREGGGIVNANDFKFESALEWPGPLTAFLVYDADGKAIGRAPTDPYIVPAGAEISVPEGGARFEPIDREG
jgi:hypothetical protein